MTEPKHAGQEPGTVDPEDLRNTYPLTADQLRAFIDRIERQEKEKAIVAGYIKEIYAEAKANGFDVAALREIVRLRKMDADARTERTALVGLYSTVLGMG